MNEIRTWTGPELARRLVFLKTVADLVDKELRTLKSAAMEQFAKGMSIPARTDEDVKLGQVIRTDPKPVAAIVDEDALTDYILTQHADETEAVLSLGDPAEIVPILRDAGRDDLFAEERVIPDHVIQRMETLALSGNRVPGIEVRTPHGWMQVKVEHAAKDAARKLLADANLLELEARS